ncbi:MAG: helix-hairpin-helix domain-containing protein [Bacteroidota bacterium]
MPSLYRLQQRLAITAPEAAALLFVAGVLLAGLGVRYYQNHTVPYAPDYYAALDAALDARAVALRTGSDTAAVAASDSIRAKDVAPHAALPVVAASAWASRSARRSALGPVRMNLNTASERLLQRLPGIGPALAGRITTYRSQHGDFAQPGHLVRVKGIGPKTFEKLEPYLFVADGEE